MLSRIVILIAVITLSGASVAVAQGQLPLDERTAYEHAKEIGTT